MCVSRLMTHGFWGWMGARKRNRVALGDLDLSPRALAWNGIVIALLGLLTAS